MGNDATFGLGADWNVESGNVTSVGTNGVSSAYEAFDIGGNVAATEAALMDSRRTDVTLRGCHSTDDQHSCFSPRGMRKNR